MKMYKLATMENGQVINHMLIVQHLPSGSYDLSSEGTVDAAVEAAFADARHADGDTPDDELREQVVKSIEWYWPSEALAAAENNEGWPISLGFVIEVDE